MKKFEKGKRFLTFLLVALMVVQQSSVTTLAEELAEYTQEAQNQDAEAVAETSEASEAEVSVPDSDKAQEQQPAAEEPAAPAEQETPQATEAPQVTEAPAQETAPTEAPAQEAEQTEAPQENAAVTEAPQATETPAVTEAPAETATKAQFSGAVDNATANVTLAQPISDKAVFVARQYSVDSDYFVNNAEAAVSQWVANNGLTVLDATAYDMHFEENGQEISVCQPANVSLAFNSPILTMTGDAGVPSNIYVLHIVNGQAVAAGSASQDGNGAVVAANVVTEGFSPFVFVRAVSGDAVEPTDIDLSQEFSLVDYVESLSIQIKIGDDAYEPDKGYNIKQAFNFAADYVLDDHKIEALQQALRNNPNAENITFSYTVPDSITGFKTVQNENLKNSANVVIGKYDISGSKVTLRFNRDFFLKDHISGNFRYYFYAAQNKVDENNNLNISFPGTSTTTIIKIEKPNLNISKSHEIKDGKIIFKIKVPKRDRDCKNVQITDVPGSNLAINKDSIKINGKSAGVSSLNENGGFTLNLGDLKAGDEVEITYEASIKDETKVGNNGGIEGLDNTVNWTATGTDSGSTTDWVWASVKTGSKSVQNDGTNKQKLNWTVSLNNGEIKADMSGKTYEDTMTSNPDNQVFLHDTLKIKTKDGTDITNKCTVSWNNDGKHFTVIFPNSEILGADAKKEFEITYTTEPQTPLAENATVSVTNNGKLDKKDVNGATGTSQNPGKEDQLTKEAVSYENDVFTWTATFTPGRSVADPIFYDILANAGNFDASTETWGWKNGYTNSVFLEDAVDLQITYDGKPLTNYEVSYSKVNVSEDMVGHDAMKIQFHGNFDKPITITYKSQGMGTPGSKYQVANSCRMGTKEARAYREFTIKNNIVKYGWSNDENGKKYLYWTIYANTPDLNNSENCLEGDMDLEGATANIVDTLPEGLKFVSATYKKWGSSAEKNIPEQNIEPVQDEDGQKLTFSIPDVRKQIIKITVKTEMERFVSSSDNANQAVYVNNVSWNAGGNESLGEAKARQEITSTILEKNGEVTGNDTVTYTIKVNQDGRKLLKNGTKLILQDKLPTNVTFGSIEITNKDQSEKLNDASYSIEDGVLMISIPDETPAIVTYTVNPVLTGIKADANGNYHIKIENSVSLKGEENVKSSVSREYELQGHSASADADRHSIIIEKKDSSEPTKKLQGAKFSLKKITFNDGIANDEEVASAETDDKGSITFGNLEFDTVYSYQETEAPEGYAKSDKIVYFCIKDNEANYNDIVQKFKKAYPDAVLNTVAGGSALDVFNIKKSTADIEATKILNNGDINDYAGKFTFTLTQVDEDKHAITGGVTRTATADANGKIKFDSISYDKADTYYYKIAEVKSGAGDGIIYDQNEFIVTVNVTYNDAAGKFAVAINYPENGVTFVNTVEEKPETTISKVDVGGTQIAGAVLQIKQGDKVVGEWTTEAGKDATFKLEAGEYVFHEKKAPAGYDKVKDFTFAVDSNGKVTVSDAKGNTVATAESKLTVTDQRTKHETTISKVDIGGTQIAGAVLQIKQGDKVVGEWTTEAGKDATFKLEAGEYVFHEKEAPAGYDAVGDFTFKVDNAGKVTVENAAAKAEGSKLTVTDQRTKHETTISKVDIGGTQIAGAVLQIKQGDKVVGEWTTEAGKDATFKLEAGEYVFHEKEAPAGYDAVGDFTFKVDNAGKVTVENAAAKAEGSKLTVTDQRTKHETTISKVDIGGTQIAGAVLQIKQGDKVVGEWTTEAGKDATFKLEAGEYVFHEKEAPAGYDAVGDFTFKVDNAGKVTVENAAAKAEGSKLTVTDQRTKHETTISKVDIGGTQIAGAVLQIKQGDKVVGEWTTEAGKDATFKLEAGEYVFHEKEAPAGYDAVGDFTFKVDNAGKVTVENAAAKAEGSKLTVTDQRTKHETTISKVDIGGTQIAGAVLQIKQGDKVVGEWTIEAGKDATFKLEAGEYVFHEKEAPAGYDAVGDFTFKVDNAGKVTVENAAAKAEGSKLTVTDQRTKHETTISKVDIGGTQIAGAVLQIKQGDKVVGEWTTEAGKDATFKLEAGEYVFHEKEAPAGYDAVGDFTFKVDNAGKVTVENAAAKAEGSKLTVTDQRTKHETTISKVDIGGTQIAGAVLQIKQGDKVVGEWTTEAGKDATFKLEAGEYVFHEKEAPAGYDAVGDFTFKVDNAGKVTVENAAAKAEGSKLTVTDQLAEREIEISKVDLTNNTELEGASLQITGTDIDGKEITPIKWKSGDDGKNENGTVKTHTVKLTAGTYTLSETAAPDGYKIAESIKFTIDKEGKVTSDTKDAVTGNKVTMKDEKKDTSASISVTKNLKTVAGENIYAVDQTFYVALYEDENCTKLASEIKALTFKNSTSETVTFEGVEPNKTYYVGECTKDGVRYLSGVVAGTKYVAQFTDGNSVTVETPNGSKAVYFDNRFMKFPDGFYKEGVLSITKLFKDKAGKAKNSDETFYAGIFDDEECTKLSENVAQNIIPLNLNGSSSVTAQIKVSIAQGTSKTFYVTEVDKDGKPINEDTFKYDVSVENGEVTFDENNTSAEVTITNQEQDEDKDKDKDKDKGKTTTTSSNATSTKAVKTGDNTPIGIFVILLIAAIVVIGGGIYLKRRKK